MGFAKGDSSCEASNIEDPPAPAPARITCNSTMTTDGIPQKYPGMIHVSEEYVHVPACKSSSRVGALKRSTGPESKSRFLLQLNFNEQINKGSTNGSKNMKPPVVHPNFYTNHQ